MCFIALYVCVQPVEDVLLDIFIVCFVQHLVPAAAGSFVGRVRREFDDVLDRIDAACFADSGNEGDGIPG